MSCSRGRALPIAAGSLVIHLRSSKRSFVRNKSCTGSQALPIVAGSLVIHLRSSKGHLRQKVIKTFDVRSISTRNKSCTGSRVLPIAASGYSFAFVKRSVFVST